MPFLAGTTVCHTLLGACRVHKNVELGKFAAEKLLLLVPLDSATYVLLSNIYVAAEKWDKSHPSSDQIYAKVKAMTTSLKLWDSFTKDGVINKSAWLPGDIQLDNLKSIPAK